MRRHCVIESISFGSHSIKSKSHLFTYYLNDPKQVKLGDNNINISLRFAENIKYVNMLKMHETMLDA